MTDSIPNLFSSNQINDSIAMGDSVSMDSTKIQEVVSFLQIDKVIINPVIKTIHSETDFITYILITMLGIIAVIWHFMPDRFSLIFSLKTDSQFLRTGDSNVVVPGAIITWVFWLNFIVSISIFSYLLVLNYFTNLIAVLPLFDLFGYIVLIIGALLLYRVIIIYATSIVFHTEKMRQQQMTIGRNIQFISGVFLTPMLILILYLNLDILIFITIAILALLQIIRVVKIIAIGKSSAMFSVLHIILYLCALEIVPVLVLVRLIGNAFGV